VAVNAELQQIARRVAQPPRRLRLDPRKPRRGTEPAMGVVSAWLRLGNIGLASKTALPHNVTMAEVHPFTFKIEADPLREMRYRWTVCEGNQIHLRSPNSYATRRDAEIEAAKALSNRVAHWRKRE
jgi:hypothetical protein